MPEDPPWHKRTPAQMGHDDPHDPDDCPVCTPILSSEAWARGAARAQQEQTHLPLTSQAPDPKPGRDGYE